MKHASRNRYSGGKRNRKRSRIMAALAGMAILGGAALGGGPAAEASQPEKPSQDAQVEPADPAPVKTKKAVKAKRAQKKAENVLNITATAYAPGYEDNGPWGDKTHLGTKVRPGVIAVDPNVIPLKSRVYIEFPDGDGMYAVAEDTGGAIKGNRIDIAMSNRGNAKDFGIQKVKVHVLESGAAKT